MKILIVSGFLGAGKTTFIRSLSKCTGKEIAILENEYGEIGVDGDILREEQRIGEVNIWELTEGCICCSTKGDFAASVLTIANTVDPEYLVVEPTGVGMLSNILANLKQIEYERIILLAPITIVDGRSFHGYMQEYPSIYKDQIMSAQTIFVSKMEQAGAEELNLLKSELEQLQPNGNIVVEHYTKLNKEAWSLLLERRLNGDYLKPRVENPVQLPDTFSLNEADMEQPENLILLAEGLIRGQFGRIVRAKGCVRAGNAWYRFDVADGRYLITGSEPEKISKAVFIGEEIRREAIRRFFFKRRGIKKYAARKKACGRHIEIQTV